MGLGGIVYDNYTTGPAKPYSSYEGPHMNLTESLKGCAVGPETETAELQALKP